MQIENGDIAPAEIAGADRSPKQKLLVVLGMHRSGTSALTRGLRALGVELGDALMPAVDGNNSKGFFEDREIVDFDDALLAAIDMTWDSTSSVREKDITHLVESGRVESAQALLRRKIGDLLAFGLKDPRIAKLLGFWAPVFEDGTYDTYYIVALRNPVSVAHSLLARDKLSYELSCLLWLDHVLTSLSCADPRRCLFVDFDVLMEGPRHEFERIAKFTGQPIDETEWRIYESEFLQRELRHSTADLGVLRANPSTPPIVADVYEQARSWASSDQGPSADALGSLLTHWRAMFALSASARKVIDALARELNEERLREKHELESLRLELRQEKAVVQMMLESRSWRWSAPLRAANGLTARFLPRPRAK